MLLYNKHYNYIAIMHSARVNACNFLGVFDRPPKEPHDYTHNHQVCQMAFWKKNTRELFKRQVACRLFDFSLTFQKTTPQPFVDGILAMKWATTFRGINNWFLVFNFSPQKYRQALYSFGIFWKALRTLIFSVHLQTW